jgi:hypothetical protein
VIYTPTPSFLEHLHEQGIEGTQFDIDDGLYLSTLNNFREQHKTETENELEQRAAYYLVWQRYGVPNPEKSAKGSASVDVVNAKRLVAVHEIARRVQKDQLPEIHGVLSEANDKSDKIIASLNTIATGNATINGLLESIRTDANARQEKQESAEIAWASEVDAIVAGAKKAFWLLVALLAGLIALTAFSLKAHAQVDCVKWQDSGGSTVGNFCAPFKVKAGANITFTKSGTTITIASSGGAGTGITTLNSLIDTTQGFTKTDDTNVTLTISSGSPNHNFALGWTGTLAKARQNATTVYTDQANTFGNFIQTFQAGANHVLVDPTDTTKKATFDLSNIGTGTTKTVNIPNATSTTAQAKASVGSQWFNSMSAQGVFTSTQPAFSDLSGSATAAQMPAFTGAVTTSAGSTATSPGKADLLDSQNFCSDAGASDTYTCSLSPAISAYVTGTHYRFKANTANTGAATINLNSLGAKTIKKAAGGITTDLADNDIRAGQWVDMVYDGTNMEMQSTLGNAAAGSGTINSGVTNIVPKYTAATTLDDSLLSDDGTTLTYSGTGGVSTSGSGSGTITLSGSTSGTYVIKAAATAANASGLVHDDGSGVMTSSAVVVADVTAVLKTRQFGFIDGSDNGAAVLADADDQAGIYVNRLGQGIHVTEVWCQSDAGSPTIQLQKDDGSATNMLSSNLSCSTSGATTTTFVSGEDAVANTDKINFVMVSAGGTAKRVTVYVKYTLD